MRRLAAVLIVFAFLAPGAELRAETGYDLWLRYGPVSDASGSSEYRKAATAIVSPSRSPTGEVIAAELERGLSGLLASRIARADRVSAGAIVAGTPATSPLVAALGWTEALTRVGDEGYVIRRAMVAGVPVTVIASNGEAGVLYGAFHLLRLIQTREPLARVDLEERPRMPRRLLNHWDNLDGSIERGYA